MASSDIEKGKGDDISLECRIKEEWKSTFIDKVLHSKSPMPDSCCIFRVPEVLRRQKKLSYQPDIVSIGPFHRGGKEFQRLENVKEWYLKCFLARNTKIELDSLIASITEYETPARNCYAEPLNDLDQNDFVEMLILDGCFLIELFRKAAAAAAALPIDRDGNQDDPIFDVPCMLEYLYHDLLLLENQLPWFVLEFLYCQIEENTNQAKPPLSQVVIGFFKNSVADDKIFNYHESDSSPEILHILDLIRSALVEQKQQDNKSPPPYSTDQTTGNYCLPRIPCAIIVRYKTPMRKTDSSSPKTDQTTGNWRLRSILCALFRNKTPTVKTDSSSPKTDGHLPQRIPSAATLSEAGVKFKKGERGCILNITFKHGVFTIPPLVIEERTGPLFRNLMAYEQCYQNRQHKITSYAVLMDNLIDTSKDVDLLCEKGIVANWLSAEVASKFFNELYNDTTVIGYNYEGLCKDVEEYHKVLWNRWREKLKRDYFGTPWATISFFAAFVLLVLTFLQTIYTIHPYYHPRD
ncbi:hypothetical protein M0R45_009682 [Rubus argutus]|uniref:Uncharacterized protein n=1 Tax=Rubus argutus TaxID=59490 RepID=A0AAW1Y875_RUBAR